MSELKLGVQTVLLPGRDLVEQFENARRYGFDAVEVNVGPTFDLTEELALVRHASAQSGLPVAAICTSPMHDPLQPDPVERAARFERLTTLLESATDVGARGVVSVPIRPSRSFRSVEEQRQNIDAFTQEAIEQLGEWSAQLPTTGAALFLEPLIRFETWFLNRVGQAADIARNVNHPRVQALADFFHMNVEESDLPGAFRAAGPLLGHVHIADNNRLQPGRGALTFGPSFAVLQEIGYDGYVTIECWLPAGAHIDGDPETAFPESIRYMRDIWDRALAWS